MSSPSLAYYYRNRAGMLAQQRAYYAANRVRILRRQVQSRRRRMGLLPAGRAGPLSARRDPHSAARLEPAPRELMRVLPIVAVEPDELTEIVDADDPWFELLA